MQASRILVAQIGARRHYAVPRALALAGLLEKLVTEVSADGPLWRGLDRALPDALKPVGLRKLLGRRVTGVPATRIENLPLLAFAPWHGRRRGETSTAHWSRRNAAFGRAVVARGFAAADTVYAFNGAAREIFQAARGEGLACVLDQTAAPWRYNRRLMAQEEARWPGWEQSRGETDATGVMADREEAEWPLADAIICGSEFAAAAVSAQGVPRERCHVVGYAGHVSIDEPARPERPSTARHGRLRVLFVGTLQLRKGLPYLVAAARRLAGDIELRLVGPSHLSDAALADVKSVGEVIGAVPRSDLGRYYAWADVLVLPTLSEGSANVCYEAMAAGVPVIATPNAGSIVRDGHDGRIVPVRDAAALAQALGTLAADRQVLEAMARAARISLTRSTLETYARGLARAIQGHEMASGPFVPAPERMAV